MKNFMFFVCGCVKFTKLFGHESKLKAISTKKIPNATAETASYSYVGSRSTVEEWKVFFHLLQKRERVRVAANCGRDKFIKRCKKTWQGWRKTWQDRKSNAKKKFSANRRQANMTGGGPPPKPMSEDEMMLLSTMPTASLVGHSDCHESVVVETIDMNTKNIATTSTATATTVSETLEYHHLEEEPTQNVTAEQQSETSAPQVPVGRTAGIVTRKRVQLASRRQNISRSVLAAETLNKTLEEKNVYKKAFYESYIRLMQQQTEALIVIANSSSARNSPYI